MRKIRTAIVGVTGYTGLELLRLLLHHPSFIPELLISRSKGGEAKALIPHLGTLSSPLPPLQTLEPSEVASRAELVFLALPHGEAAPWAMELLHKGVVVVDMSADFRFQSLELYTRAYGAHPAPQLLPQAVYGLSEWYREEIADAPLIANPGCYPTAVLLALLPFAEHLTSAPIIVDALSGVTGAGRSPRSEYLFGEVVENARAYGLPHHRHTEEMREQLARFSGKEPLLLFTPHLVPQSRGISATIHLSLPLEPEEARRILEERYQGEPFVHLLPEGVVPQTSWVRGTNHTFLSLFPRGEGWFTLVVVLDNLGKGAASQAIQNANLRFRIPETSGLMHPPFFP